MEGLPRGDRITSQTAVDYSRKWHAMLAVGTGILMATVDGSIINVSLPTLVHSLDTNFTLIQWVVLAYLLTVSTLMLGFGRLADIIGKKQIYTTGFVVFTAASALCGLSPGVYWLIGFRVLQGLGAAMIMALGAAIVTEAFPPRERGKAMGIVGSIVSVGIVVGPPLGGLILSAFSWRWIFLVNLPVGILGVCMVTKFIPALKPAGRQRFDFPGALTVFFSFLCLLLGLSYGQQLGFARWPVAALLVGWMVFLAIFIMIERRTKEPMIHLSMFRNILLSVNLATGFLSFMCLSGIFILIPFYLEIVLGFVPLKVGLLMGIVPVMLGIFSPVSGSLSDRFGSRPMTLLGLFVLLVGYLAMSTLTQHTAGAGFIIRIFALGLGMGLFLSPNNSAIMGAATRKELGVVSGMMAISRTMGQTVGIAIMGTVWAACVRIYAGGPAGGNATSAPLSAQVHGLQIAFQVCGVIIFLSLLLGIVGLVQERRLTGSASAKGV